MRMWTDQGVTLHLTPRHRSHWETGEKHFANWHSSKEFCHNWEPSYNCLPVYHCQGQAKYRQRRTATLILFYPPHCFCCFVKNAQTKLNVGVSGEHLRLSLLSSEETNCTCVPKHQNDLVIKKKRFLILTFFAVFHNNEKFICSVNHCFVSQKDWNIIEQVSDLFGLSNWCWFLALVSSEDINPGDFILDNRRHLHVAFLEKGENDLHYIIVGMRH